MSTSPREATQHPRFGATPARILIVDDSVVARAVIGRLIDNGERFTVAGAVSDARAALAFLVDNRVDMVLPGTEQIGRALWRERVGQYVSISVVVVYLKTKYRTRIHYNIV